MSADEFEREGIEAIRARWRAEDERRLSVDALGLWSPGIDWAGEEPGRTLKLLRAVLGVPQSVLARRAGVMQPEVSRIERGRGACWKVYARLYSALDCDIVIKVAPRRPLALVRREFGGLRVL